MDNNSKVEDLLEEEVRIMEECPINANHSSNNNNNNLLTEKANLIVVVVVDKDYDQEYDQEYYDQEDSGQYNDYEEGYKSYNVEVTALNINTANCFEEFEEEITPVPMLNQEPVDQPSLSLVTTDYSHSQWNSNSGEDQ
ncbi:hypothetical protein PISMIDRAFT_13308 [Pisolithus microcarpus 441]|uniref:Uncharacterized protein n=1 Tax=Pisolithus microcarpus 441 TaxID=765257 RepID=A0A0C9Y5F8_9AGAM|nr:hypothetical protein PISMIDRAFT_13308 [Pisolithus microcarpus 441]